MKMLHNIPVVVSALISCQAFEKNSENHRAIFSGEKHKSIIHAEIISSQMRQKLFL